MVLKGFICQGRDPLSINTLCIDKFWSSCHIFSRKHDSEKNWLDYDLKKLLWNKKWKYKFQKDCVTYIWLINRDLFENYRTFDDVVTCVNFKNLVKEAFFWRKIKKSFTWNPSIKIFNMEVPDLEPKNILILLVVMC